MSAPAPVAAHRSGSSSDISVLSNPSQSSIEVLNTVMQQREQNKTPVAVSDEEEEEDEPPEVDMYQTAEVQTSALTPAPSSSAIAPAGQGRNMVESSSSGELTLKNIGVEVRRCLFTQTLTFQRLIKGRRTRQVTFQGQFIGVPTCNNTKLTFFISVSVTNDLQNSNRMSCFGLSCQFLFTE